MYLSARNEKISGCSGRTSVGGGSGAWPSPLKSGHAAERSGSKSRISGVERWAGFNKSSGAWAEREVVGPTEQDSRIWSWAKSGNFAAPLCSHALPIKDCGPCEFYRFRHSALAELFNVVTCCILWIITVWRRADIFLATGLYRELILNSES